MKGLNIFQQSSLTPAEREAKNLWNNMIGGENPQKYDDVTKANFGLQDPKKTLPSQYGQGNQNPLLANSNAIGVPDVNPFGNIPQPNNLVDFNSDGETNLLETDITGESAMAAGAQLLGAIPGEIAKYQQDYGKQYDDPLAIKRAHRARSLGTSLKATQVATTLTGNPLIGAGVGLITEVGGRIFGGMKKDQEEARQRATNKMEEQWQERSNELKALYENNDSETLAKVLSLKQKQSGIIT